MLFKATPFKLLAGAFGAKSDGQQPAWKVDGGNTLSSIGAFMTLNIAEGLLSAVGSSLLNTKAGKKLLAVKSAVYDSKLGITGNIASFAVGAVDFGKSFIDTQKLRNNIDKLENLVNPFLFDAISASGLQKAQSQMASTITDTKVEQAQAYFDDTLKALKLRLAIAGYSDKGVDAFALEFVANPDKITQVIKENKYALADIVKFAESTSVDTDSETMQDQQQPSNVIPFVANCADAAVKTISKIIPLTSLSDEAVRLNPYYEDVLKVAGLTESLDNATIMSELRMKTGFEYRTVSRTDLLNLETPFVVYTQQNNAGHVMTITGKNDKGELIYSDNTVDNQLITVAGLYAKGFEGLVLVKPNTNIGEKVDSLKEKAEKVIGKNNYAMLSKEGQELVGVIVNGITKPAERNTSLSALLAICGDTDKIAQMLGFKSFADASNNRNTIVQKYYEKVGQVLGLKGVNEKDKQVGINLLAMARDVMFMTINNPQAKAKLDNPNMKVEEIMPMFVISKAVNQNVITKDMVKVNNVAVDNNEDFVIDADKLQNAVKEKMNVKNAKEALEDLASVFNDRGRGTAQMPIALIRLSDIKAVAAAA